MGLREIYDHQSFDKGGSDKGSSDKSSERSNSHKELDPRGGEIGRTIEVRDSTDRSAHQGANTEHEQNVPEDHKREQFDRITIGRDSDDRSPVVKKNLEHPNERTEKHSHEADSDMAKVSKKIAYIIKQGYVENKDEIENVIRSGTSSSNSFGPPVHTKELKEIGKKIGKTLAKAAWKLVRGKEVNPVKVLGKAMLEPSTMGNSDNAFKRENQNLDRFIFKNENPEIWKEFNKFKLDRFPDLKTSEDLDQKQYKPQREYIDYNIY